MATGRDVARADGDADVEQAPPRRWAGGQELKAILDAATAWLEQNARAINALNVFPVPDGDTGTNMLLTMKAALAEIAASPSHSAGEIAHRAAHGALMGARGNSGVILSQLLRGFARSLDKKERFNVADLAAALREASVMAYQGIIKPVEGTILTVSRDAATAALAAAQESDDLLVVLDKTVAATRASVARTPTLLAVLRESGVVDAGGQGYLVILEGAARYLRGEAVAPALPAVAMAAGAELASSPLEGEARYGYCTEFILQGQNLNYDEVRRQVTVLGDSAIVAGDEYLIRVHVHTTDPGRLLSYATSKGILRKIKIDNMDEQHREWLGLPLGGQVAAPRPPAAVETLSNIGVVAVAPGPGLARVFESLGVSAIVSGGQTMNPSTEELLAAINSLQADHVIVLPNNGNIILAAQQARQLTGKDVIVVPAKTVPQGIAAMLALNYQADAETNARTMERALDNIQTAEITRAVRSVQINGMAVTAGAVIGLLNGDLTATGDDVPSVVDQMLAQMKADQAEIITIYYGAEVTPAEAQALAAHINQAHPGQEVEVVEGGQPYYHYILSAE
jgi:DAK2 domain fusion protein YloV